MKKILALILLLISLPAFGEENFNDNQYIIRLVHGKASYSTFGNLITFKKYEKDEQEGTLNGIQLEKYIAKDLANNSLDFTLFTSLFHHRQDIKNPNGNYTSPHPLSGQDTFQINAGVKAYWKNFPWNRWVRTRIGFGEGISYVYENLDIEIQNTNREDERSDAHLLNYLDLNLAFNLRDITRAESLEDYYAGIGLSHRSGINGLINNVGGGSNYLTFFIEAEF